MENETAPFRIFESYLLQVVEKERLKGISTSHDGECLTLELNAAKGTPRAPTFRMMALKIPASYLGQVEAW